MGKMYKYSIVGGHFHFITKLVFVLVTVSFVLAALVYKFIKILPVQWGGLNFLIAALLVIVAAIVFVVVVARKIEL